MITIVATILTTIAGLMTFAGLLAQRWWFFEILSNFQLQYALFFAVMLVFFAIQKNTTWVLVAVMLLLFTSYTTFSVLFADHYSTPQEHTVRLISFNLYYKNNRAEEALLYLASQNADILVLLEVAEDVFEKIPEYFPNYPTLTPQDLTGAVILSKFPLQSIEAFSLGSRATTKVVLQTGNDLLMVYALHPPIPLHPTLARQRNLQLKGTAQKIAQEPTGANVFLAGDLNTTPWSLHFRNFLKTSGLKDTRRGIGLHTSWPNSFPVFMRIPIDHVFVSPHMSVLNRSLGPAIGSDHSPVIVEISF
ncbi:MAG: endonuclease/exonuclease/phosphatase family protein [bacterium]|nr:endonuclease/exonuclease/phosphatase family protein [bacterium]